LQKINLVMSNKIYNIAFMENKELEEAIKILQKHLNTIKEKIKIIQESLYDYRELDAKEELKELENFLDILIKHC